MKLDEEEALISPKANTEDAESLVADRENQKDPSESRAMHFRNDLQGIRAIAITSVMLFHFFPSIFPNGHVGVDQFFVLSGFLMTVMCEREKHFGIKEITWFYYRRVKRILPSYLLVILLSLICTRFLLPDYLQPPNLASAKAALKFTTNIEATDSIKEYNVMLTRAADLFTHAWSIAVEMQFYVLFPCIFLIFRKLPDWIAITWLIVLGSISLLCHIKLTPSQAFNYVHARVWQFVLGNFIHQLSRNLVDAGNGTLKNGRITIFYGFCLAGVIGTNLLVFISVGGLIHRIIAVSLTAGLILLNSQQDVNFLTSKYIVYIGHISYSLYLVHWPIYILFKQNFKETTTGLGCSMIVSILVAVVITELFEKSYLQANVKAVCFIIACFYAVNLIIIYELEDTKFLESKTKWLEGLFTPVCSFEKLQQSQNCDIPFTAANLRQEQVLLINDLFDINDVPYLSYKKCSYRGREPWNWCDLPQERNTSTHKILVIGNSYAANQGRIIYEMCNGPDVEMKIFTIPGCDMFTYSQHFEHCVHSQDNFREVVDEYRPNVLFILARYMRLLTFRARNVTLEAEGIVKETTKNILDLSRSVKDHVFVLNAIPRPILNFPSLHASAIRGHKEIKPAMYLNSTMNVEHARQRLAKSVSMCSKCSMIDYEPVFTINGTFHVYDIKTNVNFMNKPWHFTPLGLHRLRPFFKNICENIHYGQD
ncbi:hypothetical protein Aduo_010935 [Ancylostoma duodenale]